MTTTPFEQRFISQQPPIEDPPPGYEVWGPVSVTWFINPGAFDIRAIHPYAAYDIGAGAWVQHPPDLPADWGPDSISEETWARCEQMAIEAKSVLALPEPDRTLAGTILFDWIHDGRRVAYSGGGGGWLDAGNVIYQYLTLHPEHLLRRLYLCKHPEQATAAEAIEKTASSLLSKTSSLTGESYMGKAGDRSHITRNEKGMIPTSVVALMPGACGERPGEHRKREGQEWDDFVEEIRLNGIRNPLFITVFPGEGPEISEGNHRRDAAVEVGLSEVPVNIQYFGKAEDGQLVAPQVFRALHPPAPGGWDGTLASKR